MVARAQRRKVRARESTAEEAAGCGKKAGRKPVPSEADVRQRESQERDENQRELPLDVKSCGRGGRGSGPLVQGPGHGSRNSSESGSSQAGRQSSASRRDFMATKRTRQSQVTKRCAEPIRDWCRWACGWRRRCEIQVTKCVRSHTPPANVAVENRTREADAVWMASAGYVVERPLGRLELSPSYVCVGVVNGPEFPGSGRRQNVTAESLASGVETSLWRTSTGRSRLARSGLEKARLFSLWVDARFLGRFVLKKGHRVVPAVAAW